MGVRRCPDGDLLSCGFIAPGFTWLFGATFLIHSLSFVIPLGRVASSPFLQGSA